MTKRILDANETNEFGAKQPLVYDAKLWNRMISDVAKNNTWCPDVTRIIFNVGERKVKGGVQPTLATTMFFSDNTKVTCLNSEHDKITLVKDPKTGATTASDVDKERGVVYCTVKKLISTIDPSTGVMKTEGFGRILRELVAMGWDQRIEEKKLADRKALLKAKAAEAKKVAKPKRPNASLYDTVNRLADVVEKLETKVNAKEASEPKKVAAKKAARKPQKRNAKGQFV